MKRVMFKSGALGTLWALLSLGGAARADTLAKVDFESMPAFLPNWAGSYNNEYKTVTAWKAPFTAALDRDHPHSGSVCLLWQATQAAPGDKTVSLPAADVPPPASEANRVRVRFFIQAGHVQEGELEARLLEYDDAGKVLHWAGGQKTLKAVPPCDDWTEVEQETVLDRETRRILLMLVLKSGDPAAVVRLDDISLELIPASSGAGPH